VTIPGSTPTAILAVDGGNSKTDVVLLAADGRLLAAVHGPSVSHQTISPLVVSGALPLQAGVDEGQRVLARLVGQAAGQAGLPPDCRPVADLGVFCLAGADFPSDLQLLRRGLGRSGFASQNVVLNDAFAGLRAGTTHNWGVVVIMGRGVNVAGLAPDGRMAIHAPGDHSSGDYGGGLDTGTNALAAAVRALDWRGPRTALERLVPAHFGLRRPLHVTKAIYEGRIPPSRLHELAPVVFRAAGEGDAVARGIVDWLADEAAALARSAIRALRLSRLDVEVVLSGGIFRNKDEAFHERIRAGILATAPRARVVALTAPPVVGAALLGLDRLEIADREAAEQRLRATLTHERLGGHEAPR
jgi:N-acetylglucosamine kinase-like BadF-type ATPase